MKLIANQINQTHLRDILPAISEEIQVDQVLAAIAYGSSASDETQDLVGHSVDNKLRLDIWMRYDETVPVAIPLLKRLLKHQADNVFTQFIPDCFHSKVIWWKGYGAYIGSANHTDRGWLTNIETGVFIEDDELTANGMDTELEQFFDYLRELDKTIPISDDYVAEMERLHKLNKEAYAAARSAREHDVWQGPSFVAKKAAFDRSKENFKSEWLNTLGIMQNIQKQMDDNRPQWIEHNVPAAWQVDQFLHAYYYNRVGEGLSRPFEEYHASNKTNPSSELKSQLQWWKDLPEAPSNEDEMFYEYAPAIQRILDKDNVLSMTKEELSNLFWNTHATMSHIVKVPATVLGKPEVSYINSEDRLPLFTDLIWRQRNKKGWDIRQLLHYVLYEGADNKIWERLYHAGRDSEYTIPRYGLNSLAEVVGWARPEVVPPRNGRTSKALRALGYDVKIY